jgi:hypothetical protein
MIPGGESGHVACIDVPSWYIRSSPHVGFCHVLCSYWHSSADAALGGDIDKDMGGRKTVFARSWDSPKDYGAAVCACSSGGVTCIGYASGRVVALAGDWRAPIWVWDEGGRVTCACMHGGCVVWGCSDGAVCVGCLRTGDCVRVTEQQAAVTCLCCSGCFICSGHADGSLHAKIWQGS